jgi:hypothetical protein
MIKKVIEALGIEMHRKSFQKGPHQRLADVARMHKKV